MSESALLLLPHANQAFQRVGGLTVVERQLWTLQRAGIKKAWVGAARPKELALRLPPGLEVVWTESAVSAEFNAEPPYLAVSGDYFIRVETLRYIAAAHYPAPVLLEDPSGANVVQVIPSRGEITTATPHHQPLPAGSCVRLGTLASSEGVVRWLLTLGVKKQDGFMARHFDRHLSLAFSRVLLDTPVTPNMMTIFSSLIGIAGASLFLVPTHAMRMGGALLIWLHSVLDGCDGELARIRFQESPLGADIDFWGDNVVHVALFGCLAWGFYKADQSLLPVLLGLLSAVATVGSAVLNFRDRRNPSPAAAGEEGLVPLLTRVGNMLAARDFIYLLLLLAYLDRLYEFMWATAVGSLLFLFMMLYLGRKHDEQAIQPHPAR